MTERIFVPMAGGLGDILSYYLHSELGCFSAAKAAGYTTAVKLWAVNNQSAELFRHCPQVDHVLTQPFGPARGKTDEFRAWAAEGEPDFRLMTDGERDSFWYEKPRFYLSPEEGEIAREIEAAGPYVAVHPFAGGAARSLAKHGLARPIISEAAKYGRVVVLGGSSNRNDGLVSMRLLEQYKPFDINETSLVGLYSVRLHAHIASKAKAFIGSVSAYNCVAHWSDVPALVFGSPDNRRAVERGDGAVFAKMREANTAIHYLDTRIDYPKVIGDFCEKNLR
jgi:ADP-heptose:LPS heptosyltransferase